VKTFGWQWANATGGSDDCGLRQKKLAHSPGHPFYEQLRTLLRDEGFDPFVEEQCRKFYSEPKGRPSMPPSVYFRMILIGYFEGIEPYRGIAWRVADSITLRELLGYELSEATPEHSTLSRTRRLIDLETHAAVFDWVIKLLARKGLIRGKTLGIDGTMLEANAAMRSIIRRDTSEGYQEVLGRLAKEAGVEDREAASQMSGELMAEIVADKGYHSNAVLTAQAEAGIRTYIAEPKHGRRRWQGKAKEKAAVYANRRRNRSCRGYPLSRARSEKVERPFAHCYVTGGLRRTTLRGHQKILKRLLLHISGYNLGLVLRQMIGLGTPRGLQGLRFAFSRRFGALYDLIRRLLRLWASTDRHPSAWRRKGCSPVAAVAWV